MPPESIIVLLLCTWLLVAAATLWGMLRIARRRHTHHPAPLPAAQRVVERRAHPRPAPHTANA